jgi:Domain of unknown function (DUF4145)
MAARMCAYCQVMSTMIPVWAYYREAGSNQQGDNLYSYRVAAKCAHCGEISAAALDGITRLIDTGRISTDVPKFLDSLEAETTWYPTSVGGRDFPDVPDRVAACANEAYQCASIGAHMSAILMARTTIEATAKSHGITRGSLIAKIDAMKDQQLIRPSVAEAAHAIRHFGNDMAHGDIEDSPTLQDAEDVLHLMAIVLDEIFHAAALTRAILARHARQGNAVT